MIQRAFHDVFAVARERGISMRSAALIRGIERIKEAKHRRGVFP